MIHRVKVHRGYRVGPTQGAPTLFLSSPILREGGLQDAAEVQIETAPGCVVIGAVNGTTPVLVDRRRVDHERIQAVVIEICRKMGMLGKKNMDFAELCVMCGFELGRT